MAERAPSAFEGIEEDLFPDHEALLDLLCAAQERLDYAHNAVELARRRRRDGDPTTAATMEDAARLNVDECAVITSEMHASWPFPLPSADRCVLEFDRVVDDLLKPRPRRR